MTNERDTQWVRELMDLLDIDEGLSDWEVGFIEDMHRIFIATDTKKEPSARQKEKVAEIWDQHCGKEATHD